MTFFETIRLNNILNIGIEDAYSTRLKERIRLNNSTAFITFFITIPPAIILYVLFSSNIYWAVILVIGLLDLFTLLLNKIHKHDLAWLLPALLGTIAVFYFSILLGVKSNIHFTQIYVFIKMFLVYSREMKKNFIAFSLLPICLMLVTVFTPIGSMYAIPLSESQLATINTWVVLNMAITIAVFTILFMTRNHKKIELLKAIKLKTEFENKELKVKNSELDKFVFYSSHDLKSPLSALNGIITLAQNENDIHKIKEYLFLQKRAVNKLNDFINDLIDTTKSRFGELTMTEINIESHIQSTFETIMLCPIKSDIDLMISIKVGSKFITDKNSFSLIVNNLLTNAIQYQRTNNTDKVIRVFGFVDDNAANLSIYDNGIGIPENIEHKIFDMFYRGTNTSNGTGLGLYIVKDSINKIGGSIKVTSKENSFTLFEVQIPNMFNRTGYNFEVKKDNRQMLEANLVA